MDENEEHAFNDNVDQPKGQALAVVDTDRGGKTIVVNGREHRFAGGEIGRAELASLAFPGTGPSVGSSLTVAYDHGPLEAPAGLIVPGRTTKVLDGQTFSVSQTDKS